MLKPPVRARRPWAPPAFSAVILFALLSLALVSTLSASVERQRADVALGVRPADAWAKARLADDIQNHSGFVARPGSDVLLARQSLLRDPTSSLAAKVLAKARTDAAAPDRMELLMRYAHALTRRNLEVQAWFMEDDLRRNDIPGMLREFEAAASTSRAATAVLFPIMVEALDDSRLIDPVATLVARKPWWGPSFLHAVAEGNGSPRSAAALYLRLAQIGDPAPPELTTIVVERLKRSGDAQGAGELARVGGVQTNSSPRG